MSMYYLAPSLCNIGKFELQDEILICFFKKFVSVRLSAWVKRFRVSRMQEFSMGKTLFGERKLDLNLCVSCAIIYFNKFKFRRNIGQFIR